MSDSPSWQPKVVPYAGDWNDWITALYGVFCYDFKETPTYFQTKKVIFDRKKLPGESYEEGFWHLVTRTDHQTGERYPEFPRGERLPWCSPTIQNSGDPLVKVWDYEEGRDRIRTYVWLEKQDYVVILEKKMRKLPHVMFLVTAFNLDGESTRKKMRKKYDKRIA